MGRTKLSHRKTSGPDPSADQPPSKSVKKSAESSEVPITPVSMDSASIILDSEKVEQATKALPKIPKIVIKQETTEKSEEKEKVENDPDQVRHGKLYHWVPWQKCYS